MSLKSWFDDQSVAFKRWTVLVAVVTGTTAMVTGTAAAWQTLGWPDLFPVHQFQRTADKVEQKAAQQRIDEGFMGLMLDSLDSRWESKNNKVKDLKADLKKTTDPIAERELNNRIDELEGQKNELASRSIKIKERLGR